MTFETAGYLKQVLNIFQSGADPGLALGAKEKGVQPWKV